MNRGKVTTEGPVDARPGREATTGGVEAVDPRGTSDGDGHHVPRSATGDGRPGRGRRRGSEPEFRSYYGKPVLNQPTWEARDIAGYLFLGGLAGAASVVAAGAQVTRRRRLARASKLGAAGAIGLSLAALIHDLGRPARFVNMLRVFKVTSPMNMGSWLLSAYGPAAATAAASDLTGLAPGLGTAATAGAAMLGPAVAAYTAALIANTAVPAWHDGYREMPFVFVSSGATAAAGLGLVTAPVRENAPVRRLATLAGPAEVAISKVMEQRMGMVGEPYHEGEARRYLRAAEVLTAVGSAGALTLARRSRLAAALSGAALVAGSAATRFGIFHAGLQAAQDPRYTVVPQRRRLQSSASSSSTTG